MSRGPGRVLAPHGDRKREKAVTSEGLFKTCITLEQTGPESHSPYSSLSSQTASAQLLHQMICFLNSPTTTTPPTTRSHTALTFLNSCIPVFQLCCLCVTARLCWGYGWLSRPWCSFKVFIDVQSPHDVGSCCQRSQPAGVPVWPEWGSNLDPCRWVTLGLWKQQGKQIFWMSAHPSSTP